MRVVSGSSWLLILAMLVVAILAKLAACYMAIGISGLLGFSRARWSWLEGYLFGSSMVARGEVGLVVATILRGTQVIAPEQYIMAVMVIILTTIATPVMLALGFAWLPGEKGA
jgi:Kef-type K+ transport system membrane component KefB